MSEVGMEKNMDESVTSTNTQASSYDSVTSEKPSVEVNDDGDVENFHSITITNETEKEPSTLSKPSAIVKQSLVSKPSIMCRICLMNEELERLMSPCMCKGTHAYVHQQCLEYWLSRSGLSHCELCLFHFATANHLRYGMWESMRIWFSHPSNRALLQSDILLCMLLSIITFGLVAISMFCMYYLTASQSTGRSHVSRYWTETSIGVFLGIVLFAFVLNTIVVVKANIVPWFRWWRRSREIQLVIRDNSANQNV